MKTAVKIQFPRVQMQKTAQGHVKPIRTGQTGLGKVRKSFVHIKYP